MNKIQFISVLLFLLVFFAPAIAEQGSYEVPAILQAKNILPEEVLKSDLYTIDDDVITHGYTNTYKIESLYGNFTAHGNDMLLQRVHEIKAIHELDKIKKSKKFGEGVKDGAKAPFSFMKNLVTHPVDTISGVPKGLWRYGSRVGEMTTADQSEYEDGVGKELILFSAQKRKLAYDLNVDVYSSNAVLQEYLNSVSWASYSGNILVTVALAPLQVARFSKAANNLNNLMRDNSPEDLRKINRKALAELDVSAPVIEEFLDSQWLSPRHKTAIVHRIRYMGLQSGISEYLQLVSTASSEEEALFFQNITHLMAHYISNTAEVQKSIVVHNQFALLRIRKHFVFPLLVDNGYWSEFGANLINTFESELRSEYGDDVQILLWLTGDVSDRAKKELADRKIDLVEDAYETVGKNL